MSTLSQKIWDRHLVHQADGEPDLLYIDLHLVHEVTSPQAFDGLRLGGRKVRRPAVPHADARDIDLLARWALTRPAQHLPGQDRDGGCRQSGGFQELSSCLFHRRFVDVLRLLPLPNEQRTWNSPVKRHEAEGVLAS